MVVTFEKTKKDNPFVHGIVLYSGNLNGNVKLILIYIFKTRITISLMILERIGNSTKRWSRKRRRKKRSKNKKRRRKKEKRLRLEMII